MKYCAYLLVVVLLAGCKGGMNHDRPGSNVSGRSEERFVGTGNDPEIALDTQTGPLCRTIAATADSSSKFANLRMCDGSSSNAQNETSRWDTWDQKIPVEASCYKRKGLIPMYSAGKPTTLSVASPCIINNTSAARQDLIKPPVYDAVLRVPGRRALRRTHVSLAGREKTIPPSGRIEGGLWINSECPQEQDPAACLDNWLGGANELVLITKDNRARVHIKMDRDADPLGILK